MTRVSAAVIFAAARLAAGGWAVERDAMKQWLLTVALATALCGGAGATTVDGIRVANTAEVGGTQLVLNGAGLRTKFFFHVYVGALYLRTRTTDRVRALTDPGPKRLSMTLTRNLNAGQLIDALRQGIARNDSPAEQARIAPKVTAMIDLMRTFGEAKNGDLIAIDFLPDGTTRFSLNGRPEGAPIAGRNFQRGLLAVWLGGNPEQVTFQRALLGRSD